MTETEFTTLLDRYNQGLCTPEEQQQLERWMDNIREGASPFKSAAEKLRVQNSLKQSIHKKAGIPAGRSRTLIPVWMKVAASVALLMVCAYFLWTSNFSVTDKNELVHVTASGQIEKVVLPDSTIIWLKPGASLSYLENFTGNERHVSFEGEALFEVAKDPSRPFTASTRGLTAEVLGTSFNINSTTANVEVLVLTGKVSLTSEKSSASLIVTPNEKAVFVQASGQLAKVEMPKEEPAQKVIGTGYSMSFNNTSMKEVIARIEKKFDIEVIVKNAQLNNCPLSGDFTDQSLGRTLSLMAQALDFDYEVKGKTVTFTGNGCQ